MKDEKALQIEDCKLNIANWTGVKQPFRRRYFVRQNGRRIRHRSIPPPRQFAICILQSSICNAFSSFILHPSSFILSYLLQQIIDALRLFFAPVAHKVKLWSVPQIQGKTQLAANVWSRVSQGAQRQFMLALVALHSYVDSRVAQVFRNPHFGDRDRRHAWIIEFVTDNLRNLFTEKFGNSLRPTHKSKDEG
jgi:hypothetical protein